MSTVTPEEQEPTPRNPANGAGLAAMILGIVAVVAAPTSWAIITLPIVVACGVLAVYLGVRGRRHARRGEASNSGQALTGVILGSIALAFAAAGTTARVVGGDDWGWKDGHGRASFDRCIDRADDRDELRDCFEEYPSEARELGVTVAP
jgi:hypothetical protein